MRSSLSRGYDVTSAVRTEHAPTSAAVIVPVTMARASIVIRGRVDRLTVTKVRVVIRADADHRLASTECVRSARGRRMAASRLTTLPADDRGVHHPRGCGRLRHRGRGGRT